MFQHYSVTGKMNIKLTLSLVLAILVLVSPTAALQAHKGELQGAITQLNLQVQSSSSLLETLTIPANGSLVSTSTALIAGTQYTVRLSGTWVWGGCDPVSCPEGGPDYLRWGDAGYLTDNHWVGFASSLFSSRIYLEINGSRANVGSYSSDHVYRLQIIGNGSPVTFRIRDCSNCYVDNAGSLRAELFIGTDTGGFSFNVKHFQQRSMLPSPHQYQYGGWGSEPYGDPKVSHPSTDTIERWGCYLTSWAMALDSWGSQYGFHTNPHELNQWLRTHNGYHGLFVIPARVAQYAREQTRRPYFYFGRQNPDDQKLHDLLSAGTSVILEVSNGGHYVLAVGETTRPNGTRTWYINDPYRVSIFNLYPTLASYSNNYTRMEWGDELQGPSQLASISLIMASPAELLITDPQGRRTGVDPRAGSTYSEIPGTFYSTRSLDSDDGSGETAHPVKEFYSSSPLDGKYTIQVIGTGNGPYTLEVLTYDTAGDPSYNTTVSGQIDVNSVDTYLLEYSSAPGGQTGLQSSIFLPLIVRGP